MSDDSARDAANKTDQPVDGDYQAKPVDRKEMLKRQINSAIWLFFVRDEPYVANLVAWAAIDVMRSLCEREGVQTMRALMHEHIRPEKLDEWRKLEREAYTFSKHADRDPDVKLENFHPHAAAFSVFAAVNDYGSLFKVRTLEMITFQSYYLMSFPDTLLDGPMKDVITAMAERLGPDGADEEAVRKWGRDCLRLINENRPAFDEIIAGANVED